MLKSLYLIFGFLVTFTRAMLRSLHAELRQLPSSGNYAAKRNGALESIHLQSPVTSLHGIGPLTLKKLQKLKIETVSDLLLHFPTDVIDKTNIVSSISEASLGDFITCRLDIMRKHLFVKFERKNTVLSCHDKESVKVTIFLPFSTHFQGSIVASGTLIKREDNKLYLANPSVYNGSIDIESLRPILGIEPVYPATAGLSSSELRRYVNSALAAVETELSIEEWIARNKINERCWPTFADAFKVLHLHNAGVNKDLANRSDRATERLAYDELLVRQVDYFVRAKYMAMCADARKQSNESLKVGTIKMQKATKTGPGFEVEGKRLYVDRLISRLPYQLTICQQRATEEILQDLESANRMLRLLQGDVGSGKTIVSIMAMLQAIEAGRQVALLAPTGILARQHYTILKEMFTLICSANAVGDNLSGLVLRQPTVDILTSTSKLSERREILKNISAGKTDVLVGTTSLLNREVVESFRDLSLVIIDEEQRFGVVQRESLANITNVLYTTATPIPRSMMIALQQDYHVSTLHSQLPKKRVVKTVLLDSSNVHEIIRRIQKNIGHGTKIFWVTHSIERSAKAEGSSAIERFQLLQAMLPHGTVGLLHGKMKEAEKQRILDDFASDSAMNVLVTTTVIEVGIDVPDASVCIVDGAHNFGMSQLHQIRGRIGRGKPPPTEKLKESYCVLIYGTADYDEHLLPTSDQTPNDYSFDISASAGAPPPPERLKVLANTTDCFVIAEEDLRLRGPGDLFGFRQHGDVHYWVADLTKHSHLLAEVSADAKMILAKRHPSINSPRDSRLELLRRVFGTRKERIEEEEWRRVLEAVETGIIASGVDLKPVEEKARSRSKRAIKSTSQTDASSDGHITATVIDPRAGAGDSEEYILLQYNA